MATSAASAGLGSSSSNSSELTSSLSGRPTAGIATPHPLLDDNDKELALDIAKFNGSDP